MKIIFNSDLLFATYLIRDKLPKNVSDFISVCEEKGHEIIIPLTTLLEFNNKQGEYLEKEILNIKNAKTKLNNYGIRVDDFQTSDLVKLPDLIHLIQDTGVSCAIEDPTEIDFQNAHRRACLKESPHPPNKKHDEMRDLVIWEISIRIAKKNNGAILLSGDEVHGHHRGDKEASEVNLIRCNSFERAYESLSIETMSSKKIKALLDNIWNALIKGNFPIVDGAQVVSIKNPIFHYTSEDSSIATCDITMQAGNGKELTAFLKIEFLNDQPFELELRDIKIDKIAHDDEYVFEFEKPDISMKNTLERLDSLRKAIKG